MLPALCCLSMNREYTYDKRPYSAGPKYGFGKSMKDGSSIEYQPGPGHYDAKSFLKNG